MLQDGEDAVGVLQLVDLVTEIGEQLVAFCECACHRRDLLVEKPKAPLHVLVLLSQ